VFIQGADAIDVVHAVMDRPLVSLDALLLELSGDMDLDSPRSYCTSVGDDDLVHLLIEAEDFVFASPTGPHPFQFPSSYMTGDRISCPLCGEWKSLVETCRCETR